MKTYDKVSPLLLALLEERGELSASALGDAIVERMVIDSSAGLVTRLARKASLAILKRMKLFKRTNVLSNGSFYAVARQLVAENKIASEWRVNDKSQLGKRGERIYRRVTPHKLDAA